jgi:thioredoxin
MIDVTMENFEADVIAASQTTPVLVDFWADWCAPCKSLGPVLEKLETAYAGRFKLVKINADTEQQLAGAFGVKSLPTCILLMGGRPVDGFMGAVPEGKVREFLDKHLPSDGELAAQADAQEAEQLLQAGDAQAALAKLSEALSLNPADDETRYNLVKLLISVGELAEAEAALLKEILDDYDYDTQNWRPIREEAAIDVRWASNDGWTDADKATVSAHFQRLKAATDAGQVILAGRTPEAGDKTMGLVVFNAEDESAALAFMLGDPCVAAGVMLGELRPFSLALLRK